MANIENEFKEFLITTVLPNKKGYNGWITTKNIDGRLSEMHDEYIISFATPSAFEVDLENIDEAKASIKKNLSIENSSFVEYSNKAGSGIPKALLNTHLINFLDYREKVLAFDDFQKVIDRIHLEFGSFCSTFQKKRIEFNGKSRAGSTNIIFGEVRDDYWTINIGSELEIQYHMYNDDTGIGYGLGFNAQPSRNNPEPMKKIQPFINSYFLKRDLINANLKDYHFLPDKSEQDLKNLEYGGFICFGKILPIKRIDDNITIDGLKFLEMIYDLQNKQFEAYKTIFENSVNQKSITTKELMILDVLKYKKQIILQGPPGTGKTKLAKEIAGHLIEGDLENSEQFKLIQFHPSYTYEDFVRGISAKPTPNGTAVVFESENRLLGKIAKEAHQNYLDSKKENVLISKENWVNEQFENFVEQIANHLEENEFVSITAKVNIINLEPDAFRYTGASKSWIISHLMRFKDIKQAYLDNNTEISHIKQNPNLSGSARQDAGYYLRILRLFIEYLENNKLVYEFHNEPKVELKNYVLVIDEINRANLSSVLGELIYALEYRNEPVESMYEVEESKKLVLPENLYIIGTMNTADRSVGIIDYAIRRRFAFIDVLPKILTEVSFETDLFLQVSRLFVKDINTRVPSEFLSPEFAPEDVWLGHSYFIKLKDQNGTDIPSATRLEYEIKPILLEYLRDGILKAHGEGGQSTLNFIKSLS